MFLHRWVFLAVEVCFCKDAKSCIRLFCRPVRVKRITVVCWNSSKQSEDKNHIVYKMLSLGHMQQQEVFLVKQLLTSGLSLWLLLLTKDNPVSEVITEQSCRAAGWNPCECITLHVLGWTILLPLYPNKCKHTEVPSKPSAHFFPCSDCFASLQQTPSGYHFIRHPECRNFTEILKQC